MGSGEKRVFVVNEVVLGEGSFFRRLRHGYDMIVTDRRFILADRAIAQKGFAAEGDLIANEYSLYQDVDVVAGKERSIKIPFIDVQRVCMKIDDFSCNLQICYADSEVEKKLDIHLPGLPPYHVTGMSKDAVQSMIRAVYGDVPANIIAKGVIAVNMFHFMALSEKLRKALPTSIVLASEWPEGRT